MKHVGHELGQGSGLWNREWISSGGQKNFLLGLQIRWDFEQQRKGSMIVRMYHRHCDTALKLGLIQNIVMKKLEDIFFSES